MITQLQSEILTWMKGQVQGSDTEPCIATLGEGAAAQFPQAAIDVGDGLDAVWDLAWEVLEWWEAGMPAYLSGQTCPLCESPTVVDTGNGLFGDYTLSGGLQSVDLSRLRCESCQFEWLA